MKKNALLLIFILIGLKGISQQKTITLGYLELKLKYLARSVLDLPPPPPPPPPGMEMPPQESLSEPLPDDGFVMKIWFNPNFEKVVNTNYGRTTFLFNTQNKTTITLQETSGFKSGIIATAEEEEEVTRYMDSLRGNKKQSIINAKVEYKEEAKIIGGYTCKKALLITELQNTQTDTSIIWYSPDYKLADNFIFSANRLEHNTKLAFLKLINGLPVQFKIVLTPRLKLEWEIKTLDIKKPVPDKEFEVSKEFKLKSIKEFYGLK